MNLLAKYIIAMVNLYGMVSLETVRDIYNQQNKEPVSLEEVEACFKNPPTVLKENFVSPHRNHFVQDVILDYNEFDYLQKSQEGKPYYIPGKQELLKYVDGFYVEKNPPFKSLQKYMQKYYFEGDAEQAEEFCNDLCSDSQYVFKMDNLPALFNMYGIEFSGQAEMEEVLSYVMDAINHARRWENRGHTPKELGAAVKKNSASATKAVKVGRNDPCPCGSGKKYKKCCLLKEA